MLVEMRALVPEIVGAYHGGVAPGVAAAEPALLQDRDIGDAVLLGEIIGGGKPMPAAADDDGLIRGLWIRAAPRLLPTIGEAERVAEEAESGIAGLRRH